MNSFTGLDPKALAGIESATAKKAAAPFGTGTRALHTFTQHLTGGLVSHTDFQSLRYNTAPAD